MCRRSKLAYSTERGPLCPKCREELQRCTCRRGGALVPDKITAKLRIEKAGRGGKTVTVIDGLPENKAFLTKVAKELKSACATGGKAGADRIELQGDHRERVRETLRTKGWTVKG